MRGHSFADTNLSNITEEGKKVFANPELDNLTVPDPDNDSDIGINRFLNRSLRNPNAQGQAFLDGKENTSNKVQSLDDAVSDSQYPSAKCVWDIVKNKQDILYSGINIKNIDGKSILGSGNLDIIPSIAGHANEVLTVSPDESSFSWKGTEVGADVDLSNLSETGNDKFSKKDLSNLDQEGNQHIVDNLMPDYSKGQSCPRGFIAPTDGWVCVSTYNNGLGYIQYISVNGVQVATQKISTAWTGFTAQIFVSKGDEISYNVSGTAGNAESANTFFPVKGVINA